MIEKQLRVSFTITSKRPQLGVVSPCKIIYRLGIIVVNSASLKRAYIKHNGPTSWLYSFLLYQQIQIGSSLQVVKTT